MRQRVFAAAFLFGGTAIFMAACEPAIDERPHAATPQDNGAPMMAAPAPMAPRPLPMAAGADLHAMKVSGRHVSHEAVAGIPSAPSHDQFRETDANTWQAVDSAPVSTFSIDVDTASYAYVRRMLREGHLPPVDAVRVEEMVNYFPYDYSAPKSAEEPFRSSVTIAPSPWNEGARIMHIGIKGWDIPHNKRPAANLTFLIDVSGSMGSEDRLPLIQKSLIQLTETLRSDDRISIVTYSGGAASISLAPTKGSDISAILGAIATLDAGGSTAGADGIQTAYRLAESMYDADAVNRVILATDGDFNVGEDNPRRSGTADRRQAQIRCLPDHSGCGVTATSMMRLCNASPRRANGQAAYLDSLLEARKVWVEELGSTMFPIADDVKIQVEFNPAQVAEYRLVGYETRLLSRSDFNNDRVDAGEVGSGHAVTAIYEYRPVGASGTLNAPLRYGQTASGAQPADTDHGDEIAFLKIRYKEPKGAVSQLISLPVTQAAATSSLQDASDEVRFSVAVAGFCSGVASR